MSAVGAGVAAGLGVLLLARPGPPAAPTRRRTPGRVGVGVAVAVAVLLLSPVPPVPLLLGLLAGYGGWLLWRRHLRVAAVEATAGRVLESCELLVAELRAGRPARVALERSAEDWPDLAPVAAAARLGSSVPEALRVLGERPGAGDLRLVAAAWEVSESTGHGLAAALDRVRRAVRADRATTRVVSAELASARATARLVAVLPVLALLMGSGAGGDPWGFLVGGPAGWACLGGGLLLGLAGLAWIEAIAHGVLEGER